MYISDIRFSFRDTMNNSPISVSSGEHCNTSDTDRNTESSAQSDALLVNDLLVNDLPINDLPINDLPIDDLPVDTNPIRRSTNNSSESSDETSDEVSDKNSDKSPDENSEEISNNVDESNVARRKAITAALEFQKRKQIEYEEYISDLFSCLTLSPDINKMPKLRLETKELRDVTFELVLSMGEYNIASYTVVHEIIKKLFTLYNGEGTGDYINSNTIKQLPTLCLFNSELYSCGGTCKYTFGDLRVHKGVCSYDLCIKEIQRRLEIDISIMESESHPLRRYYAGLSNITGYFTMLPTICDTFIKQTPESTTDNNANGKLFNQLSIIEDLESNIKNYNIRITKNEYLMATRLMYYFGYPLQETIDQTTSSDKLFANSGVERMSDSTEVMNEFAQNMDNIKEFLKDTNNTIGALYKYNNRLQIKDLVDLDWFYYEDYDNISSLKFNKKDSIVAYDVQGYNNKLFTGCRDEAYAAFNIAWELSESSYTHKNKIIAPEGIITKHNDVGAMLCKFDKAMTHILNSEDSFAEFYFVTDTWCDIDDSWVEKFAEAGKTMPKITFIDLELIIVSGFETSNSNSRRIYISENLMVLIMLGADLCNYNLALLQIYDNIDDEFNERQKNILFQAPYDQLDVLHLLHSDNSMLVTTVKKIYNYCSQSLKSIADRIMNQQPV